MEEKKIRKISILPEILVIILGILVLAWGVNEVIFYREAYKRDRQRIEIVKDLQDALEEYYKDKGYYPHHGGTAWEHLSHNSDIDKLFDFESHKDPCNDGTEIPKSGLVMCGGRAVKYIYEAFECEDIDKKTQCRDYQFRLELEVGGAEFFNPNK